MKHMVERPLELRDVTHPATLAAVRRLPRHLFVPPGLRAEAYDDNPLPIVKGQTISQPYIVAYMTEQIDPTGTTRVLEIGTGSGYQAAVLAEICAEVYTVELIPELAERDASVLQHLGYRTVHFRTGDGWEGWPEAAPFDAIVVTCAAESIPPPLLGQLKDGGRMIMPLGPGAGGQDLVLVTKADGKIRSRPLIPVRFVPLVRERK